jgi:ATP-dependent helicase Lhr and Lhr-like helicase
MPSRSARFSPERGAIFLAFQLWTCHFMSLSQFHPVVQHWFTTRLGQPTRAQERGWAAIADRRHTLIAAPTGSGKTLAAFLTAIDDLLQEGLSRTLPDEVRVLYVSPLKALSTDIHRNLAEPRREIRGLAETAGLHAPRITAAVRTGDTSQGERAAMLRTPPHILVTTPESLYLLLTSERSRRMLRTTRTVIVDEIHAVIGTRRGAHLALSLERLQQVVRDPLVRLGLSATQKPMDEVARFLIGERGEACTIVDEGHRREMDLSIEVPPSPLEAVMAQEVWEEYYDRLASLIRSHQTTLVFVNTRRMAERLTRHLSERIGEAAVTAHHGSLSKERRLDAETRLKAGQLRALVATASLELGIDIGHVDLVCQIGSPRRLSTLLQRVGRSGHTVAGVPKGRIFPTSRDELIECAALLRAVRLGELDAIVPQNAPLDVLAQQIVAESACREYTEDDLFALVRRAWPYRALRRRDFDAVVQMTAEGFATRRGRRAALVHRDEVNGRLRARRGARLLAQTSGGAIPELADYRVIIEPEETFIGTLNEDFAIESMAGDVFQLGNASWRVLQVAAGTVRVADAHGAPPNIPFWFGEAPARSDEVSQAVSALRDEVDRMLGRDGSEGQASRIAAWITHEAGLSTGAAQQAVEYLADGRRTLGVTPTQQRLVLERFFDESGGMQLVLHAPFGSRINRAWGLALRKRFCRQFNFELQAAATDDAVLLSLGPQHSFPLADVFRYLHPETAEDVLVQAFLDAPVFQTRWRWNLTVALAVPRNRGGRRVPPQLQRMLADDLMAAVFPDAAACLENIPGDRQIPDHPLVSQTVRDCLEEAMDFPGLRRVLERIHRGDVQLVARDTPEPSAFAHDILNARPYAFLDDAPLEERRTQAVQSRRTGSRRDAADFATLDPAAITRVRQEAWPHPGDADELHDALMTAGFLTATEAVAFADPMSALLSLRRAAFATIRPAGEGMAEPHTSGTAGRWSSGTDGPRGAGVQAGMHGARADGDCGAAAPLRLVIAAERLPELLAVHPEAVLDPAIAAPPLRAAREWTRSDAVVELLRGRFTLDGPTTAGRLAESLGLDVAEVDAALLALESDGVILRGRFTPGQAALEWCDRALLARIHRYTLNRLRAEIEPVSTADFMRFLFAWQHVEPSRRLAGVDGLREIVASLDGFEIAAAAWERAILPARLQHYDPHMLDLLCLAGEVGWARLSQPSADRSVPPRLVPATVIAVFLREHEDVWRASGAGAPATPGLTDNARRVLDALHARGASFLPDLAHGTGLGQQELLPAIGVLVAAGLAASDGFSSLRALVRAARGQPPSLDRRVRFAGRWTATTLVGPREPSEGDLEVHARVLLRRYGVVCRRLLARESLAPPWRDLARVYRRLEARGEIRGGRFVSGVSGEQFALPAAVERLREVRRTPADGRLIAISTADPLNLAGILTPGDRVRAAIRHRIVYRDGVPVAAIEGDHVRPLVPLEASVAAAVSHLARRRGSAALAPLAPAG